ncbi:MBL fold metallo-hydrolase [Deinococcus roseus]|uniref:Cleavage protein n=1 Tax=Deinococcus roseus TaxID=392414 RepID=A0ABQ2CZG9_9DEIO|nr:MBL fold metallo-hydrolase [Deinococcus roseus]GGJ32469.1 cleavage protein [Deinococcus roseus]
MHITSYGAAETVTGSCHLLETAGKRILIDCGLYQGSRELDDLNQQPLPFDAASLDVVLVTHGHLDHVGRLPLLIKGGYQGKIHCTPATRAVTEIILRDAAHIAEEDHERDLRKARRQGREHEVKPPLYQTPDIDLLMERLQPDASWEKPLEFEGIQIRFHPAGHVLGSAWIEIEHEGQKVVFSGDLGNRESPVEADFLLPGPCNAVVIESTYGNRLHRSQKETVDEFAGVLKESLRKDGKVLIPSFALERTQNILYVLRQLQEEGRIPLTPIYLDSPMGSRITRLYETLGGEFNPDVEHDLQEGDRPFSPENLHVTASTAESRMLNDLKGGAIILAGSGMLTGGRIVHHLKHHLWKDTTSLVIVGYQSPNSLGGRLIAGAEKVRIHGEEVLVRASVHTIGGFSAHADQDDLLAFLAPTGNARVHLVHGDLQVMQVFQQVLEAAGREVTINKYAQSYPVAEP